MRLQNVYNFELYLSSQPFNPATCVDQEYLFLISRDALKIFVQLLNTSIVVAHVEVWSRSVEIVSLDNMGILEITIRQDALINSD